CGGGVRDGAGAGGAAPQPPPGRAGPGSAPGSPRRAGTDLVLSRRVDACPSASRPGHCPVRSSAVWLPCLSLWTGPRDGLPVLGGLDLVVAWLSGPSPEEKPRGSHPSPDVISPP